MDGNLLANPKITGLPDCFNPQSNSSQDLVGGNGTIIVRTFLSTNFKSYIVACCVLASLCVGVDNSRDLVYS
jgi:hypothetical protein